MTRPADAQFALRVPKSIFIRLTVLLLGLHLSTALASAQTGYTGIFGGGPFYKNASANITEIENSGFTEAIVWSVEVSSAGDLNFNGEFPLTSGGVYVGNQTHSDFPGNMALLKQGTVKRVTFSIGSSNYGDWEDIAALVKAQGTGPTSILYQDFAALKAAIPALDAIDFDDENSFDSATTIQFGVMLGQLGYHVAPDAFDDSSYWTNVAAQINEQLPGTVDGVHLQAYAGGSGNNPCQGWNFGSVPVFPGLWDADYTTSQVGTIMSGWRSQCGIVGGFMWIYDDFVGTGLAAQYAGAINSAVGGQGFTLSGAGNVYVNQSSEATEPVSIRESNGFNGTITLSLSALPPGVRAKVQGAGLNQRIVFKTASNAPTGTSSITVTGTSGTITNSFTFTLTISAAVGPTGSGTPVDLSSDYNLNGIYQDGMSYTTGGIDGVGFSYSAGLLRPARIYNGVQFTFGAPDVPDAVGSNGQTLVLPAGNFSGLCLLALAVNGSQPSQTFTVTYTDGTTSQFTRSLSDWFTPQSYPLESEAIIMPYRNSSNGTKDERVFNLYEYRLALNKAKTVQSITLPNNAHVIVLAATLVQ